MPGRLGSLPTRVDIQAVFQIHARATTVVTGVQVSDLAANDEAPSTANPMVAPGVSFSPANAGAPSDSWARLTERTNTLAQIRIRASLSDANSNIEIVTLGWSDRRVRG